MSGNPQTGLPRSSRPASVFSAASVDTLVADKSYRGYPSKDAYLNALREWVDSKNHYDCDTQLPGFYGTKTAEYYKNKPGLLDDRRKRAAAARLNAVPEEGTPKPPEQSKGDKLRQMFTRRKTVA